MSIKINLEGKNVLITGANGDTGGSATFTPTFTSPSG